MLVENKRGKPVPPPSPPALAGGPACRLGVGSSFSGTLGFRPVVSGISEPRLQVVICCTKLCNSTKPQKHGPRNQQQEWTATRPPIGMTPGTDRYSRCDARRGGRLSRARARSPLRFSPQTRARTESPSSAWSPPPLTSPSPPVFPEEAKPASAPTLPLLLSLSLPPLLVQRSRLSGAELARAPQQAAQLLEQQPQ